MQAQSIGLDVAVIRKDFPILARQVNGNPLVYLDNGASSQKPEAVINAISKYYEYEHSNIHRGVHYLSAKATDHYEQVRGKLQNFINAKFTEEILFTKGTTEAINLVAFAFGEHAIEEGDEVIVSTMEHHSNIVPWQMLCERKGAVLKVVPINDKGEFLFDEYEKRLSDRTKLVAVTHVSNTMGSINPIQKIVSAAHKVGAKVLIDGAQAVPHMQVDVRELDCDFYCFSSHKMYGPTGVGILYGKKELLDEMPPYQGGGDMIKTVTFEKTEYNDLPHKFEAGTPNIAGGIGIGAAIDYIHKIGFENIAQHENEILQYATQELLKISGIRIIGEAAEKACVISFLLDGTHPYDVGTILDQLGIAVRTGHHCTEPLMNRFGIPGTVRASFSMYNTLDEVDKLVEGIQRAKKMLL